MMERFVANDDSTTEEEDSKDGSNKGDGTGSLNRRALHVIACSGAELCSPSRILP